MQVLKLESLTDTNEPKSINCHDLTFHPIQADYTRLVSGFPAQTCEL